MNFSRDSWISTNVAIRPHLPISAILGAEKEVGTVPPCGILFPHGFSRFAVLFCYFSEMIEESYYMFRALYANYFCFLHSVSSHPQSLLSLCKLFEDLLQAYETELFFHLQQIGVQPTSIAFRWLFAGFVGFLEVEQLYLLWDRVIGFETLELLPMLSAALFVFKAEYILKATTFEEVEEIFYDLSQIKVVPLLQHFLYEQRRVA
mmetsp:Transcript_16940/g.18994  ORF Transcript_16940/g.18994 Transcript_16940/m.18994 type:complete len:205 (+) Transcript_16940:3-617(+)